jgi:phosphoenolpyruvate carboxykinase (GTP)
MEQVKQAITDLVPPMNRLKSQASQQVENHQAVPYFQEKNMSIPDYVTNAKLRSWVEEMIALCQPDSVHWCDGSQEENDALCDLMVENGTFIRLNPEKRPNSLRRRPRRRPHLHLQPRQKRRWPHQQLGRPQRDEANRHQSLQWLHARPHHVRHPLQHGAVGSPIAHIGVEITDSPTSSSTCAS